MIQVEDRDGIAVVRMEQGKVNALDLELLHGITETFAGLLDADAVVLTGAGRAFSAGVDLRPLVEGGPAHVGAFLPALSEALLAVFTHPRPVVAAVNGHAIAGGCLLAVGADRRLMSGGTIGLTELLVGVAFPAAPFHILSWAVGPRAADLVLTGRALRPPEAVEVGLVDEAVAPEVLLDTALERAGTLGRIARSAFALTKEQLRQGTLDAIARSADWDVRALAVWQSDETLAGMEQYLQSLAAR
jgi:enoyl-CoA hydratase